MFGLDKAPEEFFEALMKDFEERGVSAIEALRKENPRAYLFLVCVVALGSFGGVKGEEQRQAA